MYYVYILKSIIKKDEMYIGSTINLKKRIEEHNNGKEISTKRYKPWYVLYYEAYNEEKLARVREKKLKYHGNALRELKKRIGILKNGAGFTILELMTAIVVISIGVLGAYSVVQQIFSYTSISSYRLTAAYLAQEQIEIVRNARDVNWLENDPEWKEGLITDNPLWESITGFDNYKRRTTVNFVDPELNIKVEVKWEAKGESGNITVQENLYDWK